MAIIKKKTFSFEVDSVEDIDHFSIYCQPIAAGSTFAEGSVASATIPTVEGKLSYSVVIPTDLPVIAADGEYLIGVSSVDAEGNESDIELINYFFDFTTPNKPKNLRIS